MHRARRLGSPHLGAHAVRAMPEMRGDQTMGEVPAGVTLILNKPVTLSELREAVSTVTTGTGMDRSVLNDGNSQKGG